MDLRLGRVTVSSTDLDTIIHHATGQWSTALAPGEVGQPEPGQASTSCPEGKFHCLVIVNDAQSRVQVVSSEPFRQLLTSSRCASGTVVSSEMPARVQIEGSERSEPTNAGMLRHAFSDTAWETLCTSEQGGDFGPILAAKNAMWGIRAQRTEGQRNHDWVLVIRASGVTPLAGKDQFDQVLDAMRYVDHRDRLLCVQMASAVPALCQAGSSYQRSEVMTQFDPEYPPGDPDASHKFVAKQRRELSTDMFSPAVLLLHPQVIKSLATKIISESTWEAWIADAIDCAEATRMNSHSMTSSRGPDDVCWRVGVVPILWSAGSATMSVMSSWSATKK